MKNNNISLIIGISIPILMIVFVGVSIYLPAMLTHPKCSFLYGTGSDYYQLNSYDVQNGKLLKNEVQYPATYNLPNPAPSQGAPAKLYVHDVEKNVSQEISLEDAQKLNLSSANISPDGFEFFSGSHDYSIFSLFFSRDDYYGAKYIRGHGISKRLNLQKESEYWYHDVHFLGWIIR